MADRWTERRTDIQAMVDAGATDEAIGRCYGVSATVICKARKQLGIMASRRGGGGRRAKPEEPPTVEELETYIDEHGRTVTRCPTRYADGGGKQPYTVRPRRG